MMEKLFELAERCEKADGPDREMDAEIAAALRIGRNLPDWAKRWDGEWRPTIAGYVVLVQEDGNLGPNFNSPEYTASLDAGMTLVPEGWNHGYRFNNKHQNARACCEFIPEAPFAPQELLSIESRKCATPALALCAAALRARAAIAKADRPHITIAY